MYTRKYTLSYIVYVCAIDSRHNNKRQMAMRRSSPPLRFAIFASRGGQRSASMASSNLSSMAHALQASILPCNFLQHGTAHERMSK